LFIFGHV